MCSGLGEEQPIGASAAAVPGQSDEPGDTTTAVDALRQQHAAEMGSIQDAFAARMQAMQDDLEVSMRHHMSLM